jgi:hypothetical protein
MPDEKQAINLEEFDFGFSLVDADQLEAVQQVKTELASADSTVAEWQAQAEQWRQKAQMIYNAVQPLLSNLSKEPEKEYILWPGTDRVNKINAFKLKLMQILED